MTQSVPPPVEDQPIEDVPRPMLSRQAVLYLQQRIGNRATCQYLGVNRPRTTTRQPDQDTLLTD